MTMWTDEELNKLIAETEDTGMQAALRELLKLPPDRRQAEIDALTKAYDPLRTDLRSEIERNYNTVMGASPQGQMAGSNQFSVYVGANPLEHLGVGMMKYKAGKDMRSQKQALEDLSTQESGATSRIMQAQLASILRKKEEEEGGQPWWMRRY